MRQKVTIQNTDGEAVKSLAVDSLEKLKPFMKNEKDAAIFASMNRKQRRAFLAKNKKRLKYDA